MTVTLAQFFPHFNDLIQTPADVQRLNAAILQLAVQGKLVPQDPTDEPASVLLRRIAAEKKRLVEVGKLGKEKPLPPISEDELAFELPLGWAWARLVDVILAVQTGPFGSALHKSDYVENGTPVVNPANIQEDCIRILPDMMVSDNTLKRLSRYILEQGDIVMGRRGEMGRCALVTEREAGWLCGSGSFVLKTSSEVFQSFLIMMIRSPRSRAYLAGGSVGATMNNLNHRILNSMVVAFPPLAEQKRIVAKVDELLAQTRALEVKLRHAAEAIVVVNRAVLHRVQRAPDPTTFQHAWATLRDHFADLTTDPRTLTDLRQTILQLAVQGKLVPQDPHDEPASELLARIAAEKERLSNESEHSGKDQPKQIMQNEKPYDVPKTWAWVRVYELGEVRLGRQRSPEHHFGNYMRPYLRAANVTWDGFDLSDVKEMDFQPSVFETYLLRRGDILLNEASGSASEVGKAAIWNDEIPGCCFQNTLIRVRLYNLWPDYIRLHFINDAKTGRFGRNSQGIGINHLGAERLAKIPIALPPLAEQKRIVAKVDELLARCDALAAKLSAAQVAAGQLTAAVLAQAVG